VSEIKRNGKLIRPCWNYTVDTNDQTNEYSTMEMTESIRNVLEKVFGELQQMRRRLDCHETLQIPGLLRQIAKQTKKRKYVRKVKA
jgi:hypothetical protein